MIKRLISLLALTTLAACMTEQPESPLREESAAQPTLVTSGRAPDVAFVEVTTSAGNFTLRLDGKAAPLTVAHFLKNVDSGFYAGTVFHRIIPGFMIQGGGYTEDFQQRETSETIPNESGNGLANLRSFINVVNNVADEAETANLDPAKHATSGRWGYAVFGYVAEGMDVIDLIAAYETDPTGPGGAPAPIIPVIIENMTRVQPE